MAQKKARLSEQQTRDTRRTETETVSQREARLERARRATAIMMEHETHAQKEAQLSKNRAQINAVRDSVQKELAQARVNRQAVEAAERLELKIHPKSTHMLYRKGARDEKKTARARAKYYDVGDMKFPCHHCGALHWFDERTKAKGSIKSRPLFGDCCRNGRVRVDQFNHPTVSCKTFLQPQVQVQISLKVTAARLTCD